MQQETCPWCLTGTVINPSHRLQKQLLCKDVLIPPTGRSDLGLVFNGEEQIPVFDWGIASAFHGWFLQLLAKIAIIATS